MGWEEPELALERRRALAEPHGPHNGHLSTQGPARRGDGITPQRVAVTAVRVTG